MESAAAGAVTTRQKLKAIAHVARYDPKLVAVIVALSLFGAVLEGVGIGFLFPIVEQLTGDGLDTERGGALFETFERMYGIFGVPLTLGTLVVGVGLVVGVRYLNDFIVAWLQAILGTRYVRDLMDDLYEGTLDARVGELDDRGSEELLNAVITETGYPEEVSLSIASIVQESMLCVVYLVLAFYLAPLLTIGAIIVLGGLVVLVRLGVRPAYVLGSRMSSANEEIQRIAQAGIHGRREVRLFPLRDRIRASFGAATEEYTDASITLQRNEAVIENAYLFLSSVVILALVYGSIAVSALSPGALAVFLFAMYRLAAGVGALNDTVYEVDSALPHCIRLQQLADDLAANRESAAGGDPPAAITELALENVSFSYDDEPVVRDVNATLRASEFVAFVGPSGAGKSTVASLIARLYEPCEGRILANGAPIDSFSTAAWRSRIALVTQDPYIFNGTLRFNLCVGNPSASTALLDRACKIAGVAEFFADLGDGYDTELGDDGVRLSGGQRQRVALARALVKDSDVLVLDEATSQCDASIEAGIHASIAEAYADRLTIVITHRLSTVSDADRIYVMESGRIVNSGPHKSLLADRGRYASLVAAQRGV